MSAEFIDTHLHLTDEKFEEDRAEVLKRAALAGVTRMITMGDTMESSALAVALATREAAVYAAVGVHPEEAFPMTKVDFSKLAEWTKGEKVVAIGEIGLDYYWEKDEAARALQRKIFIQQLHLARDLHLPVCVHDREAHGDTLVLLKKEGQGVRGVMHCYSGSVEMARELVKMDWLVGIDGPLTFKNAAKLPDVVRALGKEDFLLETDAPYLAPTPYRGKRNEPSYVTLVAEKLAELRGESMETIAENTTKNAKNLYQKLR